MLSFLKNHPFAVEAFFESSLIFTFAVAKEELAGLIPECLQLDTLHDKWAFITIAMVQTKALRPKGFPKFLGNDFFLVGYRVFVKYYNKDGKRLRGLFILKSETDKRKMKYLGNIFTHYNYTLTDIIKTTIDNIIQIKSVQSDFSFRVENIDSEIYLPEKSPFADWKEARKYAGPLPFTFTYNAADKNVLIIEGVRQNWMPKPIKVIECHSGYIDKFKLGNIVLASAFMVANIPYYWKKGREEKWKE